MPHCKILYVEIVANLVQLTGVNWVRFDRKILTDRSFLCFFEAQLCLHTVSVFDFVFTMLNNGDGGFLRGLRVEGCGVVMKLDNWHFRLSCFCKVVGKHKA